jgi:hypothetical protein
MTPPIDPASWVRLPVPLTGLQQVSGAVDNETFAPANTVAIPADLDEDDPSAFFRTLPSEDDDDLVTDQVFTKPVEPYALKPDTSLRSRSKLRVYFYQYSLDAGQYEEELQTRAGATAAVYTVPVDYLASYARAFTEINDQPPPPPEPLTVVEGSAAPVLGAGAVASLTALDEYQVKHWEPTAGYWDDEEGFSFLLKDWLTLSGTSYYRGLLTTNGYVAVPETAAVTYSPSLTNPANPKLLVGAGDYEARLIAVQQGTNYVRLRTELRPYGGAAGDPATVVWEATFFHPMQDGTQLIEVRIGSVVTAGLESSDLTLASASTAYATATLTANTSYVFVGDATGSQWVVNSGYHVDNATGVYAHDISRASLARLVVEAELSVSAVVKAGIEEKPTQFFTALSFQGNTTARTISTPNVYPAFIIHKAGTGYQLYAWFGASVFNRAGQATDVNGGAENAPKYASLGYVFDYSASVVAQGFTEYGLGYYKLGTDANVNINTSGTCNNIFSWVLGGNGAPRLNTAGSLRGGVDCWNVTSNWGFSTFAWVGKPAADYNDAIGMPVGHGLRDREGNKIKPQIVFAKRYYVNNNLRNPISVAGEVLGADIDLGEVWGSSWAGYKGNYYMELARKDSFGNTGVNPAYLTADYLNYNYNNYYKAKVADEDCVYMNNNGKGSPNSTMIGWAFANVPGSCKIGRVTSQGATTTAVITGFPVRMVIMKCITASSSWLLFGQQTCLATGAFEIHTNAVAFSTTIASVTFTGAGFDWANKLSDEGQEWLYIAVGGYGPDEVIYAAYLEPGAFGATGIAAGSKRNRIMAAEPGAVEVGEVPVVLAYNRSPLAAEGAEVSVGGQEAILWKGRAIDAVAAEVALEGQAAALFRSAIIPLTTEPAQMLLTGQAALLAGPGGDYWTNWGDQHYLWVAAYLPDSWAS